MHKRLLRALLPILSLTGYASAYADGWEYGSRAALTLNTDDNPTLIADEIVVGIDPDTGEEITEDRRESIFRFLAYYEFELQNQTANRSFNIRPRVSRDYFPDREDSDLENFAYNVPGFYSITGQTTRFNLGFSARQDQAISNDINAEGNVQGQGFRADDIFVVYSITPTFTWTPTPNDQFFLSGSWSKQDFDLDFTGRSDFEGKGASLSYSRTLTPRQTLGLTAQINNGDLEGRNCLNVPAGVFPDNPPCSERPGILPGFVQTNITNKNSTDLTSFTVDYSFRITPTLEFRASIGRQNTETEQQIIDDDGNDALPGSEFESDNETYNIGLTKSTERSEIRFTAGRSTVLQSVNGTPQDRDTYDLTIQSRWTPKIRTILRLNYRDQQSVFFRDAEDGDIADRIEQKNRFYNGELQLRYQLSRKWSAVTAYRYQQRDIDGVNDTRATSNLFRLGFIYTFKELPTPTFF